MKIKIAEAVRKEGNLISVTLELQEPREINIYQKFLADEPAVKACPHCGAANKIGADDLRLRVDAPLADKLGLSAATPLMTCDSCGKVVELSMVDYTAFPSVVAFIAQLRNRYMELKKERSKSSGEEKG